MTSPIARANAQESFAKTLLFCASIVVLLAMFAIVTYLAIEGTRLFFVDRVSPLTFLFSPHFSPDTHRPGALSFVVGSIAITLFSICIGGPLGIAVGVFLSQLAPKRLAGVIRSASEILVGIPSVVFGWVGLTVLAPFVRTHLGSQTGFGLFTAGIVLSMMILPTVIALSEDALRTVATSMRDGSMALGATRWQTIFNVTLPSAASGLTVAVILGVARAIGETLAVQMVIGNAAILPHNIFSPTATLTTEIITDMGSAPTGSILYDALFSMALLLLLIAMGLIVAVRLTMRKA